MGFACWNLKNKKKSCRIHTKANNSENHHGKQYKHIFARGHQPLSPFQRLETVKSICFQIQ